METELHLFDDQPGVDLSDADRAGLYQALQAVFSPRVEDRLAGMAQVRSLDGHLRSPLIAAVLVHRLRETDLNLLGQVVELLVSILQDSCGDYPSEPSRRWAAHGLRQLGGRELDNLLKLVDFSDSYFDPVAALLNECSLAGESLVNVFTDGRRDLSHRLLAIRLIDKVGFLEAIPMIEHWIIRLTSRQERQMRMSFAPAPDSETEKILPALKQARNSLQGGDLR
jgi:hypothetical protein